jgi:outer membrane protein assembly factor BamB
MNQPRIQVGRSLVTSLLAVLVLGTLTAAESDWPQFRGPNRDGLSTEGGLLTTWPEGGPNVLWRVDLGDGYSGLSVVQGRLYTMYAKGSDEYAVCLDASSGKQIWRVRVGDSFQNMWGDGPRSTPTVHGGLVYALGARGRLYALKAEDGEQVWMKDLNEEYGAEPPRWGVATSPLVEGDLLLVDVGGRSGSSIVAFDKATGKQAWKSQSDKAGYSTPIAITVNGVRQVIFLTGTQMVSLSPADGSLYWRVPWKTQYDVNASTPVFVPPDKVFVSTGYDVGGALFRIEAGDGKARVEQVWKSREMKNKFSSSVFHGGYLFGFDEKTLKCLDARTGEVKWRARGLGHGSLFYADGHLVVLGAEGTLVLLEANAEQYREKARAQIFDGRTWTVPTLAGGRLYVRDRNELVSLNVSR